jgi:hypothetical protein
MDEMFGAVLAAARFTVIVYVFVVKSCAVTTTSILLLPTFKAIGPDGLPLVTAVPLIVNVDTGLYTAAVTVTELTSFAADAVYAVVPLLNAGDSEMPDIAKLLRSALWDLSFTVTTKLVAALSFASSLTVTVTVELPLAPATGVTVIVRFAPLPPSTIPDVDETTDSLEDWAVTVKLSPAVSASATVKFNSPVDELA